MTKILLLEDDEIVMELLSDAIKDLGFETIEAFNCSEALKFLDMVDGMISDGELPDGLGLEIISRFKKRYPSKPTALLSGNSEIVQQAVEHDFVDLALSKSHEIESKLKKIEKLFNQFNSAR